MYNYFKNNKLKTMQTYFIESEKGILFSSNKPCNLIILFANLQGLFSEKLKQHNIKLKTKYSLTKY